MCVLQRLTAFTQHSERIHPRPNVGRCCAPPGACRPSRRAVGLSHFSALVHRAAVNVRIQMSAWACASLPPGGGIAKSCGKFTVNYFKKSLSCLAEWLWRLMPPSSVRRCWLLSIFMSFSMRASLVDRKQCLTTVLGPQCLTTFEHLFVCLLGAETCLGVF